MQIERGASNTLVVMARVTLSPSYWLLHFTDIERGGNAYCVVQPGNSGGAFISLTFTETTAPVALDGEVLLAPPGNWNVKIYEQTSSTNLVPASANRLVKDVDVFVVGDGVADGGWTETCPTDGGECDPLSYSLVNSVNFELDGGSVPDPCGGNLTLNAPDATAIMVDSEGDELERIDIPSGDEGTLIAPDVTVLQTDGNTALIVGTAKAGSIYLLPQTIIRYNDGTGFIPTQAYDTLSSSPWITPDVAVEARALTDSTGTQIGTTVVTLADLLEDTVPPCPDGTITFDGLPVGTVPSGDTENLDCGTTIESAHVTLGSSQENGIYFISGTAGGKTRYQKNATYAFEYSGTRWVMVRPGTDHQAAVGNQAHPWLADWTGQGFSVDEGTISQYCGGNVEPCADLTIAINGTTYGTVADPCGATAPVNVHDSNGNDVGSLVSGAWVVAAPANVLREYTASDTWNKPASPSFVGAFVVCVGAGAGGACGDLLTGNAVQNTGGSGGGGGWVVWDFIAAASLGGTESVTVPTGGAGQPGRNTDGIGIAGANGGDASFGTHVIALGGRGGNGNTPLGRDIAGCTPRRGSNILPGHPSMRYGNNSGAAGFYWPTDGVPVYTLSLSRAPGGAPGGNGGFRTAGALTTSFGVGRVGGTVWDGTALTGGGSGGATVGANGNNGTANIVLTLLSSYGLSTINGAGGGGGGGSSGNATTTVAGNGGNGTIGAGGGGGGAGLNGVGDGISGDGGNGGAGIVYVYEIYKI